jgi:hypothetical protein
MYCLQDFLSAADYENTSCRTDVYDEWCRAYNHTRYTELQIGPAPTQMHTFEIGAASRMQWTEWMKGYQAPTSMVHSRDYATARAAVESWMANEEGPGGMPVAEQAAVDAALAVVSSTAPRKILAQGMPWGGLAELLISRKLAPGCPFNISTATDHHSGGSEFAGDTQPWLELLRDGKFSARTLALTPTNFEVGEAWIAALEASAAAGHGSWLHGLFLATAFLERGEPDAGRSHLRASIDLKPTAHAYRALAVVANDTTSALAFYLQAWACWEMLDPVADPAAPRLGKDLALEIAAWLTVTKDFAALRAFLPKVPASALQKDRVLHAKAALAVYDGDHATAKNVLRSHCFQTYSYARRELLTLWWQASILEARAAAGGRNLTRLELVHLRRRIGCDGDQGGTATEGFCARGPPNLGCGKTVFAFHCLSLLFTAFPWGSTAFPLADRNRCLQDDVRVTDIGFSMENGRFGR